MCFAERTPDEQDGLVAFSDLELCTFTYQSLKLMSSLTDTLSILSAMTTPAVLVLASGSLITTASQRLSGSMDQQRDAAKQLRDYQRQPPTTPNPAEHTHLTVQLSFAARRARLLQQAMTILHVTLGFFIASICAIGLFEFTHLSGAWVVALLSVLGSLLMFVASVLLIRESRLALNIVREESTFLTQPKQSAGATQ